MPRGKPGAARDPSGLEVSSNYKLAKPARIGCRGWIGRCFAGESGKTLNASRRGQLGPLGPRFELKREESLSTGRARTQVNDSAATHVAMVVGINPN